MVHLHLATLFFLVSSSLAAHSSNANSHARRSIDIAKRGGILDNIVPNIVDSIPGINGGGASNPLNIAGGGGPGSSSTSSSSSSSSSTESSTTSATTTTSDTTTSPSPSSTSSSSSSSTSSSSTSSSSDITTSSTTSSTAVTTPLSNTGTGTTSLLPVTSVSSGDGTTITSPPVSSPTDTSSSTATTSTDPCPVGFLGLLGDGVCSIVSGVTSAVGGLGPTTSSSDTPTTSPTNTPTTSPTDTPTTSPTDSPTTSPTDSPTTSPTDSPTTSPTDSPTSDAGPTTTTSSAPGNILSSIISIASSVFVPPPTSVSSSDTSSVTDAPTSASDGPTSASGSPTSAPPTSDQAPPTSASSSSTSGSSQPTSIITSDPLSAPPTTTSSSTPIISFPGGNSTVSGDITSSVTTSTTTGDPLVTTITSISVDPALSFVLTESSLALASIATTTPFMTLTDPDQATTTISIPSGSAATAETTPSVAPLPTGIPGRILPANQLSSDTALGGYTLISILFTPELNWPFVVDSPISSSQIFAYIPVLIEAALGISGSQVYTFALQVYVPTDYQGPSDASNLGTMWLGYIPTGLVDELAAEIKVKTSAFYTGVSDSVAQSLAQRVNSGFSLRSVSASAGPGSADPGSDGSSLSGAVSSSSGSGGASKSRQDAIIGVVSALGAIALLVLVFLVYRSLKRRRQLAHHRLSDPPDMMGVRPEGREFDEDSVGGARRRSFYFAEDSLRGYQAERPEADLIQFDGHVQGGQQPQAMSQRRVVPAAISAPILRESSMNW